MVPLVQPDEGNGGLMEALRETHGVDVVLGALRILSIRCGSRPESKSVAAEMAMLRASVRDKKDAWEAARDERIAATGEIAWCDSTLDGAVMSLSRQATAMVDGKTSDPRYRVLFPAAPSVQMKPVGGAAQSNFVKGVLRSLEEEEGLAELRPLGKAIAKAQKSLDAASGARDTLQVTEDRARTALEIELDAAREAYNQSWHRLNVIFPKDKALVESFFRPLSAKEKSAEPADPADPPK